MLGDVRGCDDGDSRLASVRYHALDDTFVKAPITTEPKGVMECEATATLNCGSCQHDKCKAEADAFLAVDKKCINLNVPCGAAPYCDFRADNRRQPEASIGSTESADERDAIEDLMQLRGLRERCNGGLPGGEANCVGRMDTEHGARRLSRSFGASMTRLSPYVR